MKIPKTFVPDKNLDAKIEALKASKDEKVREITLEELMENNMSILYDKKNGTPYEFINDVVSKIVNDTFENKIKWEQDTKYLERYTAHATVLNGKGEKIKIPILFYTDDHFNFGTRWGYLHLGNEYGPCRNTCSSEVNQLVNYFGIDLTKKRLCPKS